MTDFCSEGYVTPSFPNGRMRLESGVDLLGGHKYNFLFWCPETFPSDIMLEWDFIPIKEPGLCMVFFAATGRNGEDIFDDSLKKRTGDYPEYHHGDINAFHLSYFRRNKHPRESGFHTCNLRKSYGFHLLAMGADPIPNAEDAVSPYNITVVKHSNKIAMYINNLQILQCIDDGETWGPLLKGGKIGFRQMAPVVAEYANFKVYTIA